MVDYEKAYKEAKGIAEKIIRYYKEHNRGDETSIEDLEQIFPELKESKDEKIRKTLIRFFKDQYSNDTEMYDGSVTVGEALAWLEKQGKYKDTFSVPTKETILSIWELGNDWKDITHGSISTKYGTQLEYIQKHWQESEYYLEKQGNCSVKWQKNTPENKPAINHSVLMKTVDGIAEGEWDGKYWHQYRWSTHIYDSNVLYWMELSELDKQGDKNSINDTDEEIAEAVKDTSILDMVEPKQEWSEEDEEMTEDLIKGCVSSEKGHHFVHTSKEIADWLKSLKDRMKGKEE